MSTESQINVELALPETNKATPFICENFDAYEQEKENDKKTEQLTGTVFEINERTESQKARLIFRNNIRDEVVY